MKVRNGRTRRERANADNLKAQRRQPCMRCGQRIDYDADPGQADAFNAGHIQSWVDHPELREDPSNLQQEHAGCGKSAGKAHGTHRTGPTVTSEEW